MENFFQIFIVVPPLAVVHLQANQPFAPSNLIPHREESPRSRRFLEKFKHIFFSLNNFTCYKVCWHFFFKFRHQFQSVQRGLYRADISIQTEKLHGNSVAASEVIDLNVRITILIEILKFSLNFYSAN